MVKEKYSSVKSLDTQLVSQFFPQNLKDRGLHFLKSIKKKNQNFSVEKVKIKEDDVKFKQIT